MTKKLKLEITLGNDAMQRLEHLAVAMRDASVKVQCGMKEGRIRDVNGNTVGHFEIVEETP